MSGWDQYTRDAQMGTLGGGTQSTQSPPLYSVQPASFQGPGQDTTPFGYTPNYGVTDPYQSQEFQREYGLQQGLNAGQVQAGPQFALNQNTREQLAQQLALGNAQYGQEVGFANQDYQTSLARLGLQGQQLGVQRGALGRQPEYLSTLHGLTNQSLQQSADSSLRHLNSDATARGAYTSIGVNADRSDISAQLANQLGRSDTQYNEQVASLADQNKMLDLQASNLGLDRQQLKTELERGLSRLGLQNQLSIADLTAKINSSNIEDQMIAQQIFNAAIQNSDYYSQFYPGAVNQQQALTAPTTIGANPAIEYNYSPPGAPKQSATLGQRYN